MKDNNKTIILLKDSDIFMKKVFEYNFKGADIELIPDSFTPFDREKLASQINNNYSQVIFYDYYDQFYLLLPLISKKIIKKYIIHNGIAILNNEYMLNNMLQLYEYKERGLLNYIATTRYDTYISLKDKIEFIKLDYKSKLKSKEKNDSIGILGLYYVEYTNFFVQLTAIAMSSMKKATVLEQNNVVKKFGEDFNVKIEEEKNIEKLIIKNKVNLDCRFSDVSIESFLISMDAGIPCILGNTSLLDDNSILKDALVLESDDDVNEISEKISSVLKNKEFILKTYSDWREQYSNKSKESIEQFLKLGGK